MASNISVTEAAEEMGVTPQFLRLALQQGRFGFGVAVRFEKRWSYYINRKQFQEYMQDARVG